MPHWCNKHITIILCYLKIALIMLAYWQLRPNTKRLYQYQTPNFDICYIRLIFTPMLPFSNAIESWRHHPGVSVRCNQDHNTLVGAVEMNAPWLMTSLMRGAGWPQPITAGDYLFWRRDMTAQQCACFYWFQFTASLKWSTLICSKSRSIVVRSRLGSSYPLITAYET